MINFYIFTKIVFMKKYYLLLVVLMGFGSVSGQNIVFADANFKAKLLFANAQNQLAMNLDGEYYSIDTNNDGEIDVAEALQVKRFTAVNAMSSITNLSGIEYFTNIETLSVNSQALSGTLTLPTLPNLTALSCNNNDLTGLYVANLPTLLNLSFDQNNINTIDLSALINLRSLNCYYGGLLGLNLTNNTALRYINCRYNYFSTLNLTGLTELFEIDCSNNMVLNELYVPDSNKLKTIYFENTGLTSIDLTHSPILNWVYGGFNASLQSVFLKGSPFVIYHLNQSPNLQYFCVDESKVVTAQNYVTQLGYNCVVNSYCSFQSGSEIYNIEGNSVFDSTNTSCNTGGTGVPNMKVQISSGTQSAVLTANNLGEYAISVGQGMQTLTPLLENPSYFNVSPTTQTVSFPATTSPFTQNFCVTPNGVHQDLEVAIIPTTPARPGFDAFYKLLIKNKGNIQQSGSVTFTYNDAVLDYLSANPLATTQATGTMTWDFANLQPFETREIALTLNVNSPMETPAVNGGDVLNYTAVIASSATDDMPLDNTFSLPQIVVNSFDPNDKTCLEGTSITPDMIGKYVHYMIRFENTGTFPAENIVVKDMIDATKFDVASLIPLNASHDYTTRITGNKVEFIFENINLPFEDATNDGYIVFKIKTLPTLALGDSFSNSASIYFDYNFPIVTDPAVTTFATLATQDFVFNNYLTVYPNPTNDVLNLTAKQAIELKSMSVYNVVGQLVLSVPNAKGVSTIDVSNLTAGTYFLKVVSDKGTSNVKFMKK